MQGCIGLQAIWQKPFTKTAQQNLSRNQKRSFPFKQPPSEYINSKPSASHLQAILLADNVVLSPNRKNAEPMISGQYQDPNVLTMARCCVHLRKGRSLSGAFSRTDTVSVQFPRRQVAYREVMARLATFLAPTSSSLCCTGSSSLAGDQRNSHRACNMTC